MTIVQPTETALTAPFWEGVDAGETRIQRCSDCGRMRFYPTEACPHCASERYSWQRLSGRGRVYSWTVVHRSVDADWQARAPYVAAIIAIEEQEDVLVPGLLTGIPPESISADLPVEAWFERASDGHAVYRWRPAG